MKKSVMILILIGIFLINFNLVNATTNVTECGTLSSANTIYQLNQSINSSFDCIIINATNITLDCQGYNISFGNATGGKGIRISNDDEEGYDNVTVQNCVVIQNESGADHTAIFFGMNSENGVVYNNTIFVFGVDTPGMLFESNSVNANISFNNITASGGLGSGIVLSENGSGADIRSNTIITSGDDSNGILIGENSSNGTLFNNTITTSANLSFRDGIGGIFLELGTNNVNVSSNTINTSGTDGPGIWIWGSNHSIDGNTIITSGEQGDGIYMSDVQGINLTSNTITISGISADGIHSQLSENSSTLIYNNVIMTSANYSYGIYLLEENYNNISSNNITTSGTASYGIYFNESHNATLLNNIIKTEESDSYVLYLDTSTGNFYNNIFNTSTSGSGINFINCDVSYFNTSKTSGTNIIGRGYIGGNFWTNNLGTGYSDNCIDSNGDYVCDVIYSVNDSIDYLPLADHTNVISACGTLNIEDKSYYLNQSLLVNGTCFNITANNITLDFNGYNITGNTTGNGINVTGYNETTILDGLIYNFSIGIYFKNNSNNNITNITSNNNYQGIAFTTSSNNNLTTLTTNNNTANGILLESSSMNNVFTNIIAHSNNHLGIYIVVSSNNNTFTDIDINYSGIGLAIASGNTFTNMNISNSTTDAILLQYATSDNNNFTNVVVTNTSASYYDINFSTAGIDGTWIKGINFGRYTFAGAGGKVNFEEPNFGKVVFLEAINGSGTDLSTEVDIENNSVFVNSSANSGLNKSANITLYSITYTDPKPQYSSNGVTFIDCTATTDPACAELGFSGNNFVFNVSHFTYFRSAEAYITPSDTTSSSSGGGGYPNYRPKEDELNKGYQKLMYKNWKVSFKVENISHTFKVGDITETNAKISISSETQEAVLSVGEEKKFELSEDNYYDILVKLNSIDTTWKNRANFTIQTIHEEIVSPQKNEAEKEIIQPGPESEGEVIPESEGEVEEGKTNSTWLWVVIAVIIILILSGVGYKKFRK